MRNIILGMALLAVPALGGEAHAAERGPWYIGAGAGRSMFSGPPSTVVSFSSIAVMEINSLELRYLPAIGGINALELHSLGVRVYGGFRVNRYFALEAGYADLGEITFTKSDSPCPPGLSCAAILRTATTGDISAHGRSLGARGFLPLGEGFELNGRLGVFRSTATLRAAHGLLSSPLVLSPFTIKRTAHRTSPLIGIGMSYRIAPEVSFTLDWERISKVGRAETTGEMSVKFLSAGIRYDF